MFYEFFFSINYRISLRATFLLLSKFLEATETATSFKT